MKDSGIPWVGEIPNEWSTYLTSTLFHEHKERNLGLKETNLLSLSYGNIKRKDINTTEGLLPQSFETYNIVSKGDIVFRLTDLQNDKRSLRTGLCKESGIITSAYVTLRSNTGIDTRYFHYLYHSYDICKVFYGLGDGVRQGMNYDDLRKVLVLLPSFKEQQAIADFLDKKCSEIDELISLQEKIIEELKAYKQSVITEAVTKGLNPDVPMKDSGIEWIGKIPSHWQLLPSKRVFRGQKRIVGESADGYERLALTMRGVIKRDKEDNEGLQPEKFDGYQVLKKNEIVFKLIDLQNEKTSRVGLSPYIGIVSPAYIIISNNQSDNRFYYYWFLDMYYRLIFNKMGDDGVRSSLSMADVLNIPIPSILFKEQQAIADFLDKKCSEIDSLIALKQDKIEYLKEYKKSIIYEYTTGKKDVNE